MPIIYINNDDIRLNSSSSDKVVVNGNLGIGTTSPTAKLNIGSAYEDAFVLTDGRSASPGTLFDSSITWDAYYADAARITLTHNDYNTADRRLHFDLSGVEIMSLKSGNVGIGTNSPTSKLDVWGDVSIANSSYYSAAYDWKFAQNSSNGRLAISYYNSEKLSITDAGNVGIGTTTPSYLLDINGSMRATAMTIRSGGFGSAFNSYTEYALGQLTIQSGLGGLGEGGATDHFLFRAPNLYEVTTTQGGAYSDVTSTYADTYKNLFTGQKIGVNVANASIYSLRMTWNNISYKWFDTLYVPCSFQGNTMDVTIEKYDGTNWVTVATRTGFAGWEGRNVYINAWNNATHSQKLRITFDINWNTSNGAQFYRIAYYGGYPAGSELRLFTWDYERNTFFNAGNVGVGTTGPSEKLHVVGNGLFTGGVYVNNTNAFLWNGTNGVIRFGTNDTERVRISAAGNVGIGTTSPYEKLHVAGKVRVGDFLKIASSTNYMGQIGFNRNTEDGTIYDASYGGHQVQNYNGTLEFQVYNSSGTYVTQHNMFDNGNVSLGGNVGIGTTNPTTALVIQGGGAGSAAVTIQHTAASGYSGIDFFENTGTLVGSLWHANSSGVANNQNAMTLSARNAGDKVYIVAGGYDPTTSGGITVSAGNVGIGTTSPTNKLDIRQSTSSGSDVLGTGAITIGSDNPYWTLRGTATSLQDLAFDRSYAGTWYESMRIQRSTGNVGIGTTSPSVKLHTVGDGLFYSDTNTNLTINSNGGVATLTLTNGAGSQVIYGGVGGSNNMDFYTGSTFRMRIDSSGNVGIGTTSPSYKLQVNGDDNGLYVRGANVSPYTQTIAKFVYGGNSNSIDIENQGGKASIQARVGASTMDLLLNAAGSNVGIGTTSPSQKLEVSGNILASKIGTGGSINTSYDLYNNGTTYLNGETIVDDNLYVTTGNVGIGITSPTEILHLARTATDNYIKVEAGGQAANYSGIMLTEAGINWGWTLRHSAGTDALYISYQDNTPTFSDTVTFSRNGNVGIGTTSPYEKLEVNGAISATGGVNSDSGQGHSTTLAVSSGTSYLYAVDWGAEFKPLSVQGKTIDLGTGTGSTSSRLHITNAGNVGIGTTSPSAKLDVAGSALDTYIQVRSQDNVVTSVGESARIRFSAADTTFLGHIGYIYRSSSQYGTHVSSRDYIHFETNNDTSAKVTIDNSGNVGIGTTSPQTELHVKGNNGWGEVRIEGQTFASGHGGSLEFYSEGTALADIYASTDKHLYFRTNGTNERMRITSAGNVGIGTTSPDRGLTISRSNQYASLNIYKANTTNQIVYLGTGSSGTDDDAILQLFDEATEKVRIFTAGSSWFNGGNVGIGTTAPDSKFHVEDTSPEVRITGTGGTSFPRILWEYPVSATQASRWALTSSASGNNFYLYNYTQSKKVFQVDGTASHITLNHDAAGTTQIGTSTTQTAYQLYVATNVGQTGAIEAAGSVKITSGALGVNIAASATAGRIDASNDIVAYSTSDKRLKENIKPIENALDKVKSLTGVEFDWIEETKHVHGYEGHDVGVIAQEVQEVLPEAIRTNDSGYLSVRYEKLIGLLIESNKELAARVELLEQKLKQ